MAESAYPRTGCTTDRPHRLNLTIKRTNGPAHRHRKAFSKAVQRLLPGETTDMLTDKLVPHIGRSLHSVRPAAWFFRDPQKDAQYEFLDAMCSDTLRDHYTLVVSSPAF